MPDSSTVCVLLYHHVGPVSEPRCKGLTVSAESFARQIATLSAMGYVGITPDDWSSAVKGRTDSVPERSVMITFDDAYTDLAEHALPVLERRSFPATVFVPTALIGQTISCNPAEPGAALPIMSAEQIREWSARGVIFGAHSARHVDLTSLPLEQAAAEIEQSRDALGELTGVAVTTFAYPYGKYNDQVASLVRSRFDSAFTTDEGVNDISVPIHLLRRSMVQHSDSVVDVLLRARYGKSVLQKVKTAARSAISGEKRST